MATTGVFSHTLTSTEKKYSAFDRELHTIYLSVRNFKHFLEGKPFIIFTDHKPLIYALTSSTDNRSPRQTRHLSYIAEFSTDLRHIKGERNIVADALSRPTEPGGQQVPTVSKSVQVDLVPPPPAAPMLASLAFPEVPSLDFQALAAAQDPGELLPSSDLQLRRVRYQGVEVWCDVSGGRR